MSEPQDPRVTAIVAGLEDPSVEHNGAHAPDATDGEHALSWAEVRLGPVIAGLLDGSLRPPEPTLCRRSDGLGLFYTGRVNGIHGESGAAKTWIALYACRQEIETGRHVVFLDFEDNEILTVGRLLSIGADPESAVRHFHYVSPDESFGLFAKERIEAVLATYAPSLAVVDSTGEAMSLDGTKSNIDEEVAAWNRRLPRWIARRGPAVLALDHVTKATDGRGLYAVGSHRKRAMVTGSSFLIEAVKEFGIGQHGIARLVTAKDRCGHHIKGQPVGTFSLDARLEPHARALEQPYTCLLEPPEPPRGEASGGKRPTWLMEAASKVIEATPGLTKNAVVTSVGKNRPHTILAIEILVSEGYVEAKPGPNRSQLHRSGRPYRQAEDPKLSEGTVTE